MTPPGPEIRRLVDHVVATRFPAATGVVLAGSTATGTSTPTSDVDLLVLGPGAMFDDGRTSLAATVEESGRLVELFAYTPQAYREWAAQEVAAHRPVILAMLRDGMVLRSDAGVDELRAWATGLLAAGPVVDPHALDLRRYRVSGTLDDLADARDPLERAVLLAEAFHGLAELLLLAHGQWLGHGKWLVRRLRECDAEAADSLGRAVVAGDVGSFVTEADTLLAPLGGRLQAGMVR
ncbi:nucleotidyltransferase domain-containing protein [Cellulomonas flavigena]|uniref:nucleotidyltransferase domain-containing protein n=1 Tax=Cellulomonas flavigena TaxID=1711 RepID=UPI0002E2E5D9|nr:nucleotidyltransferase domain-containing protein [Cellulomonas flavigena]